MAPSIRALAPILVTVRSGVLILVAAVLCFTATPDHATAQIGSEVPKESEEGSRLTYQNPLRLENEWYAYGIGDPYILRWNGRYYLYPSTKTHGGGEVGVRGWVSKDLVHWRYLGYVSTDPETYNAFAPEVVYWNGNFYMYTSSDGQGHYVLKSDSPSGPFIAQTENIGLSIDGSVFIDDDGTWYFTHAGFRGIRGYRMIDPYTVGSPRLLEADLGAWTEGPMIVKRAGYYYLTYTGNHVRSAGYRVHYAVSEEGPLGPYVEGEGNPILLNTEDGFHGLGHSSSVLGPDLDSYYIAYHNILNRLGAHIRELNIDRLVFNGKKMAVLGPTRFPQNVPKMPDFYTWVDEEGTGERWTEGKKADFELLLSRKETENDYTAEFNFQAEGEAMCLGSPPNWEQVPASIGSVFSYRDGDHFLYALVDLCDNTLSIWSVEGGDQRFLDRVRLPEEFDFTRLHTLRVVKVGDRLRIFFDNMLKSDLVIGETPGGRIGYIHRGVDPVFRYTAFSNDAGGSSDGDVFKPIPGSVESVHYAGVGYSPASGERDRGSSGGEVEALVTQTGDGGFAVALRRPGDELAYNVNVERDGLYAVAITARTPLEEPTVEWLVDGRSAAVVTLREAQGVSAGGWFKVPAGRIELREGTHTLGLRLIGGELESRRIDFHLVPSEPFSLNDTLTGGIESMWRTFGAAEWLSSDSGFGVSAPDDSMIIAGDRAWSDYAVRVDIDLRGPLGGGEVGLLVRATQPSYHPDQVRDAVVAYYVAIGDGRLGLRKLNYGRETLEEIDVDLDTAGTNVLKVEAEGPTLRVFWNDMDKPVMVHTDADAWMHGAVGLRSNTTKATFRNLYVRCLSCSVYGEVNVGSHSLWITPHETRYEVVLPFGAVEPPRIAPTALDELKVASLIDPRACIEVRQAQSVPGEALIEVVDEHGALVHEVVVAMSKAEVPVVRVGLGELTAQSEGWMGKVGGGSPSRCGSTVPTHFCAVCGWWRAGLRRGALWRSKTSTKEPECRTAWSSTPVNSRMGRMSWRLTRRACTTRGEAPGFVSVSRTGPKWWTNCFPLSNPFSV